MKFLSSFSPYKAIEANLHSAFPYPKDSEILRRLDSLFAFAPSGKIYGLSCLYVAVALSSLCLNDAKIVVSWLREGPYDFVPFFREWKAIDVLTTHYPDGSILKSLFGEKGSLYDDRGIEYYRSLRDPKV